MVSPLTVLLLSCWLAGHSGTWGQREFPKPLVGGSPRWVVAPGENVSIRCEGRYPGMEFFLRKAGHPTVYQRVVPAGTVAEFPLPSVGRADAGSYTCEYRPTTEPTRWSHLSDPVEIIVAEPSDPKPNISLRPSGGVSLGASVSVRCRGQRLGRQFVLKTAGGQFLHKDPDGYEAEFPLSPLHREQGGSYSCSYHSKSGLFTVSYPSDPVELVLRDPSLPRPSVSLSPTGVTVPGADVTIRCQGLRRDVRFFLHQAGDLTRPRPMDPAGDGAEFHIRPVGRQHGGNYSCSYRPRAEPFVSSAPSDPVGLVVAGETDLTQPRAAPDPTRPGSAGTDDSEQSGSDGLSTPLIAGVSVAAIGLLLLLLAALVCFVRTRARKGDAPRPSSTIPLGALKVPAQQDPVYASVDEGKQPQSLPQEPDPDGLTYAELDHQALQAKRGAPAPEPVLYAAVSRSRGAPP
ncbi:alpha-1B-glycoprotein-like isoform X1 [Pelodiscus sinensis]|uniref:alpha-1B-glycoprotein-like isoform X1 n=1 Tax=Pelodiscus sinensis TaxID=13735 RepID=UPI003F6ACA08